MNEYVKYVILFGCLLLFGFIAFNVYKGNDFYSDGVIYDFVSEHFIGEGMTPFIKFVTWFGSTVGIVLMCIISLFIFRDKKINVSMIICLIIGTILNNALKVIFMRARPDINPLVIEKSYSFPSGHSMVSMIFYGYLIYLIYNHVENKKVKLILISLISVLVLNIGFTRIYLGVHYASDVIGGFILGIAYLILYIEISKKIMKKI